MSVPLKRDLLHLNSNNLDASHSEFAKRHRTSEELSKGQLEDQEICIFKTVQFVRESVLDFLRFSQNNESIFLSARTTERYFRRRSCNLSKKEYLKVAAPVKDSSYAPLKVMISFCGTMKCVFGADILQEIFRLPLADLPNNTFPLGDGCVIRMYHQEFPFFKLSYSSSKKHDLRPFLTDTQQRVLKNLNQSHIVKKCLLMWDHWEEHYNAICSIDSPEDDKNIVLCIDKNQFKIKSCDIHLKSSQHILHSKDMSSVDKIVLWQQKDCSSLVLIIDHTKECAINTINLWPLKTQRFNV